MKRIIQYLILLMIVASCSQSLIVVSETSAYHPKYNAVFEVSYDSGLHYYDHFKVSAKDFKKLKDQKHYLIQF